MEKNKNTSEQMENARGISYSSHCHKKCLYIQFNCLPPRM
uniref:Uncharacterized protein n=1 Tax=Arundo donax TaxID=35708 RepID=A0A0A8ZJA9_ARUDO